MRLIVALLMFFALPLPVWASDIADMAPRDGWVVAASTKSFEQLLTDTRAAVQGAGLAVVTQAGPTGAAERRGITIPGNRIIGVFNNDYAVRVLRVSTAAMIEAPLRLYVTENANGTATLSYKIPSVVFSPYGEPEGVLDAIARDLDALFDNILRAALN